MTKNADSESGQLNVDSEIEKLEKQLAKRLPDDYRAYLQTTNGGRPHSTDFVIPKSEEGTVGVLYGVGVPRGWDIFSWLKELDGDIPKSWIPIGRDLGGNVLLMDLSKETESPILLYDRNGDLPNTTDKSNTYLLAPSFSQFLTMLR